MASACMGPIKGNAANLPSKVLPTVDIPFIKDIPVLGTILSGHYFLTYVCIILAILLAILVYRTPFGLHMQACGLDAHAADSVGIKVDRVRLIAVIMSGIFAALGGAYLSIGISVHLLKQHDRVPWMDRYCGTGSRRRQLPHSHLDNRRICYRTGYRQQAGPYRPAV